MSNTLSEDAQLGVLSGTTGSAVEANPSRFATTKDASALRGELDLLRGEVEELQRDVRKLKEVLLKFEGTEAYLR